MKKVLLSVLLVCLLTSSFMFVSCSSDGGGGSGSTGTFCISITGIPPAVMSSALSGDIIIVMGHSLQPDGTGAVAGRDLSSYAPDDVVTTNTFTLYMYAGYGSHRYIGTAGNYDIGFIDSIGGTGKVIRDRRLEVNALNVIPYSLFGSF